MASTEVDVWIIDRWLAFNFCVCGQGRDVIDSAGGGVSFGMQRDVDLADVFRYKDGFIKDC